MWPLELCVVAFLVISIFHWIYKWRNPSCNGKLPPGSMGYPLIGETLQLMFPSPSLDVPSFIQNRVKRYGPLFRTSIAGHRIVMSTDPEFNKVILNQEESILESWYMDLFAKMFKQGERRPDGGHIRKYTKLLTLSHFGAQCLRTKLLPQLEEMIRKTLNTWSTQESIEVKRASAKMALHFGGKFLFAYDPKQSSIDICETFTNFSQAIVSFPLNIPGTAYYKSLQDHRKAMDLIRDVVKKKLASHSEADHQPSDLLDFMIEDMKSGNFLTEDLIVQIIFGLTYATYESTSLLLTLAFKLLEENPRVLKEMTAEHEEILKKRENPDSPITWEEYRLMRFTLAVINETLRLASVSLGLMRRARRDINSNGYTIPAGWIIMIVTSSLHLSPDAFEDPLSFNPWRWNDLTANTISNYFIPFGEGRKQCVGSDYERALLSIFFHVLVTKFRWTKTEGGEVGRYPSIQFRNGLHIKITPKD